MKVTEVRVKVVNKENSKVKGYATVILDSQLAIHKIRIIEGENRLFAAMPSVKEHSEYYDLVHPINMELRNEIENAINKKYEELCGDSE